MVDDIKEDRGQQDAKKGDSQHATEDSNSQSLPHFRSRTSGEDKRNNTENKGQRGHQDRPQTQVAGIECGLDSIDSLITPVLGELHDQDGVLAGQTHQHHKTDLRKNIDLTSGKRYSRNGAQDTQGNNQNDGQGE